MPCSRIEKLRLRQFKTEGADSRILLDLKLNCEKNDGPGTILSASVGRVNLNTCKIDLSGLSHLLQVGRSAALHKRKCRGDVTAVDRHSIGIGYRRRQDVGRIIEREGTACHASCVGQMNVK